MVLEAFEVSFTFETFLVVTSFLTFFNSSLVTLAFILFVPSTSSFTVIVNPSCFIYFMDFSSFIDSSFTFTFTTFIEDYYRLGTTYYRITKDQSHMEQFLRW
jgi:hypothetical protein